MNHNGNPAAAGGNDLLKVSIPDLEDRVQKRIFSEDTPVKDQHVRPQPNRSYDPVEPYVVTVERSEPYREQYF